MFSLNFILLRAQLAHIQLRTSAQCEVLSNDDFSLLLNFRSVRSWKNQWNTFLQEQGFSTIPSHNYFRTSLHGGKKEDHQNNKRIFADVTVCSLPH